MLIKRKPRILWIDGYGTVEKGKHDLYDWLSKYIPEARVINAQIPSQPKNGLKKFKSIIGHNKFDLVVGFSMGGMYAGMISDTPRVLINPGYSGGKNNIYPELLPLEDMAVENPDTYILFSKCDNKFGPGIVPATKKKFNLVRETEWLPGKHVPTEEEVRDILCPKIKNILGL